MTAPVEPASPPSPAIDDLWTQSLGSPEALAAADPDATYHPPLTNPASWHKAAPESDPRDGGSSAAPAVPAPGVTLDADTPVDGGAAAPRSATGFALRATLGQGGMGIVYRAEQELLRREVAYKTPLSDHPQLVARFMSEALVTGFLEHPNIVPVHTMGHDPGGRPYFAMKLVHGTEWTALLHPERREDPGLRARAARMDLEAHLRILIGVCHAVAFAHARGILHRDLKPDNVMVGDFGEIQVMDWGIAIDMSEGEPHTLRAPTRMASGIGGTPSYMAPEMARGDAMQLGPRTDVYLLGAILLEILTGKAPHSGKTMSEVLAAAAAARPPSLPDAPPELAAICLRALAADPEVRQPDVRAFQGELESFLAHRHSLLLTDRAAAEEAALAALPATDAARSGSVYDRHAKAIARFEQALELWDGNAAAREGVRRAHLLLARVALENHDLGLAAAQLDLLEGDPEAAALVRRVESARRELEARELKGRRLARALVAAVSLVVIVLAVGFFWVSAERNAKALEAERARAAQVREAAARRAAVLELANGQVNEAEYRLGRHEWAMARERVFSAWKLFEGESVDPTPARLALYHQIERFGLPLAAIPAHDEHVRDIAFSPDGRLLATSGGKSSGRIVVRDIATLRELASLEIPFATDVYAMPHAPATAWSPDGKSLAIADRSLRRWDWKTGRELWRTAALPSAPEAIAFSPDGSQLLVGGDGGLIAVYDASTGRTLRTLSGSTMDVKLVRISADGKRALSWGTRGPECEVRGHDLASGQELWHHAAERLDAGCVTFTADESSIWTGGRDHILRMLAVSGLAEQRACPGHSGAIGAVALSADGRTIVSGAQDGIVKMWNAADGAPKGELGAHSSPVSALALSADGRLLASASEDGQVALWSTCVAARGPLSPTGTNAVIGALSPTGATLATASVTGALALWDVATGAQLKALAPESTLGVMHPVRALSFSADGRDLHAAFPTHLVTIALDRGSVTRRLPTTGPIAFDRAGTRVLTLTSGQLTRMNLETGAVVDRMRAPAGPIVALALAPDGRRALVAGRELSLVDLDAGRLERTYPAPDGSAVAAQHLTISPDGTRFVHQGMAGSALVQGDSGLPLAVFPQTMVSSAAWLPGSPWFVRHDDGHPALHVHDGRGVERRAIAEDMASYGFLARPLITPDGRELITFFHLPRPPGTPYVFHLGLADDVRAQIDPASRAAARAATVRAPAEVSAEDRATLARWFRLLEGSKPNARSDE